MTDKEKKYLNYLNEKFNEANFIEFIQDLLNLEQSDFSINEVLNIQDTYKEYIKKYKKVASYSIGIERIGVFIIEVLNIFKFSIALNSVFLYISPKLYL